MKVVKLAVLTLSVAFFLVFSSTQFVGCSKTKTDIIHDTTVVNHTDTLVVVDSVYDVTDGLVAYYDFKNGSTNDKSGFGNDIAFNNAVETSDRLGNANGAYLFDGVGSYMTVPNDPTLGPTNFTFMVVCRPDGYYLGTCHGNQLLGKGNPDNIDGYYFVRYDDFNTPCGDQPDTTKEIFGAGIKNAEVGSDTLVVRPGQWYTVFYTYDGHTAKMYVNGKLTQALNFQVGYIPNTNDLFIGRNENPAYPYWFKGAIDEVRIYNRALPFGAIKQLSQ